VKTFSDGTTLKRYDLPSIDGEGWASVVIGADGFFAAVTDYGNYAHAWPHREPGDFRVLLCRFDGEYILGKVARKEYDGDATAKAIRERVREMRKAGQLTARQAMDERALLEEHDEVSCQVAYALWHAETTIEVDSEFTCERWPVQAVAFVEKTLPRLRERILAEMAEKA
jgi:hypothetical protein